MYDHGMIAPVLALALWTFVMWVWMYATRIPAMQKAKIDPNAATRESMQGLPREVTRVADNYNHLHEQPTIFYAVALATHLADLADPTAIGLAWAFVVLRVLHSLVQAAIGNITLRFLVFTIGTIALLALTIRTAMAVFA